MKTRHVAVPPMAMLTEIAASPDTCEEIHEIRFVRKRDVTKGMVGEKMEGVQERLIDTCTECDNLR